MQPFKLSGDGSQELFRYCNKNLLFEVTLFDGFDFNGFLVRRVKKGLVYNKLNLGKIFEVKKDDEESNFTFFPDPNLIFELEIEDHLKLMKVIGACMEK